MKWRYFYAFKDDGRFSGSQNQHGYGEFSGKAEEYKKKAEEGMKEDAEEAREKEKLEREIAMENRRVEREKTDEYIQDNC